MDQVLPVEEVDYDPSVDITGDISNLTAEQYLTYVRRQTRALPDVLRAKPRAKPQLVSSVAAECAATQSASETSTSSAAASSSTTFPIRAGGKRSFIPRIEEIPSCPAELQPDPQWERQTLFAFSEMRAKLALLALDANNKERKIVVPRLKDEASWHEFCFLSELPADFRAPIEEDVRTEVIDNESDWGEEPDEAAEAETDNMDDGTAEPVASVPERWSGSTDVSVSSSLLLQLDQVMTQALLHFHVQWLNKYPISHNRAQWLYSILMYIDKPLHRDSEADVRHLYRVACKQRASLLQFQSDNGSAVVVEKFEGELATLNTLILIAGSYFGQGENCQVFMDPHERPLSQTGDDEDGEDDDEEEEEGDNHDDSMDFGDDQDLDLATDEGFGMNFGTSRTKRKAAFKGRE